MVAVDDQWVMVDGSTAVNIAAGEAFASRVRAMLDALIARTDPHSRPLRTYEGDERDGWSR